MRNPRFPDSRRSDGYSKAEPTRERVLLEPMTPVERKVVHEHLKDVPGVETSSEGTEPNRYVVVLPA